MAEDFIDISPDVGGSAGKNGTVFQEGEWKQILDNPNGLTKEGIEEKIKIWSKSNNKHVKIKYETMKARCKNVQPSGKTPDGKIILANVNGVPVWTKPDDSKPKKKVNNDGER